MSEEKMGVARRALEAIVRRDRTAFLAVHDQDFEVVPIRDWPEQGVRGSQPAWDFYLRAMDVFVDFPADQPEIIDAGGDKVLLHPQFDLRGRGSGADVEWDFWNLVTIRGGKILRAEWYTDHAEALEAAGLQE